MLADDSLFILRFYGEGIHPDSFTAKELGNLLIKVEDAVKSIIQESYPEANPDNCILSLVKVKDESGGYYIQAQGQDDGRKAFYDWGKAIGGNTYVSLPYKAYEGVNYLHSLVKKKSCNLKVVHRQEEIANLNHLDLLNTPENSLIAIDTTVVGQLEKIGGLKPTYLWLKIGERIKRVRITAQQATDLSPRLFQTVSLRVNAGWDANTDELSRIKLLSINEYQSGFALEAIHEIRSITSGFWDKFDSDDDILQFLRG